MANRNLTLSLPEELVRRVRVFAARNDISVSAFVGSLIESVVGRVDDDEDIWAREETVMRAGVLRVGEISWSRDDVHERKS